jgi:hypothetical protein
MTIKRVSCRDPVFPIFIDVHRCAILISILVFIVSVIGVVALVAFIVVIVLLEGSVDSALASSLAGVKADSVDTGREDLSNN